MAVKVFPYRAGSRGAKAVAEAMGGRVLLRKDSKYRFREEDFIINWGAADCPFTGKNVANQPDSIEPASNKLTCFNMMKGAGVSIPPYWTRKEDIPADSYPVMCRTMLHAHSGAGIVIADNKNELVKAPLYTQYIKKKHEYRIHVLRKPGGGSSIIISQRKAKRNDAADANFKIRNLANGFVYVIDDHPPACVVEEARKALESTALAFGAVDVIYNEGQDRAYVLEINTAPGLEDRTAEAYAKAFKEIA